MKCLSYKNVISFVFFILLIIIMIISILFYLKYNDEIKINNKLLSIPKYAWREYIDYLKTEIKVLLL